MKKVIKRNSTRKNGASYLISVHIQPRPLESLKIIFIAVQNVLNFYIIKIHNGMQFCILFT